MTLLAKAFFKVRNYFDGDIKKTMMWFNTENPALGNVTPFHLIDTGREKKLIKFIESSLEGNFP